MFIAPDYHLLYARESERILELQLGVFRAEKLPGVWIGRRLCMISVPGVWHDRRGWRDSLADADSLSDSCLDIGMVVLPWNLSSSAC